MIKLTKRKSTIQQSVQKVSNEKKKTPQHKNKTMYLLDKLLSRKDVSACENDKTDALRMLYWYLETEGKEISEAKLAKYLTK